MKRFCILLLLLVSFTTQAETLKEIREVLKHIETNHDPTSLGDYIDGVPKSYGILQIQKAVIIDVNEKYGTNYTHRDAFKINCAEEIFILYVTMWSKHLELKENRTVTTEDIVRIWNGGPNGYKRNSTMGYLAKFKKRWNKTHSNKVS